MILLIVIIILKYTLLPDMEKRPPSEIDFSNEKNDYFIMFGKESSGIPYDLLNANLDSCYRLPMVEAARSLNLSNCVLCCI